MEARRADLTSILFVCQGNICRSPYAAAAFRKLLRQTPLDAIHVSSAGFVGPGRRSPPEALAVAARHGVDLTSHRSQLVDAAKVRGADLVVVMDPRQKERIRVAFRARGDGVLILADLMPALGERRMIRDPLDKPEEVFEEVYTQIDECLGAMRRALVG